jgi:hypothetical protein
MTNQVRRRVVALAAAALVGGITEVAYTGTNDYIGSPVTWK